MSILMVAIGATVGAVIGSLYMQWRKDVDKDPQQLESKTPYDYALTNAINERDRLQDELRTIRALRRTESDTERIRNEIGTLLSDGGEEESESVYGGISGIPIIQHSDGTISPFPRWDGMSTEDDEERSLINDIKDRASENLELAVEFAKMTGHGDDAIRKRLEESSKELSKEIGELRRGMREFREEGKN